MLSLLSLVVVSACGGVPPLEMVHFPTSEIVGEVISITPTDNLEDYVGKRYRPSDIGIVRIEKIESINNPDGFKIPETFIEGDEVEFTFGYGTRPAIVRTIPNPVTVIGEGDDAIISIELISDFQIESGIPVYINGGAPENTIEEFPLPGISVGQRFRARVTLGDFLGPQDGHDLSVAEYELIAQ